jgi:hypothetical protein
MRLIIIALALGLFGQAEAQSITVVGGQISCGTWVKDLRAHDYNRLWLIGFLSGVNAGLSEDVDILKGQTQDSLIVWTDNYCRQNPLEGLAKAAIELSFALKRRSGLKAP